MRLDLSKIHEIEKHIEFRCGKRIADKNKKRLLRGKYVEVGEDRLHTGDVFMAYEILGGSALDSYKCYISWFNGTIQREGEKERIAVSAEWVEEEEK